MADFRRWILALAVLSLFVGFASAQPSLVCSSNAGSTPTIRSEGMTELVGDIVITCAGGAAVTAGTTIPTANITIFFGTAVTSRTGFTSSSSEALLMIDDPGASLAPSAIAPFTWGATQPQVVCPTPSTGCTAETSSIAGPTYSNSGSNILALGAHNVYQGLVSGNSVTFQGVPILAPGTTGNRVFRITNVRVNASGLNASGTAPAPVNAFISVSGSTALPLTNSQIVVGYATPGLKASVRLPDNSGGIGSTGTPFPQCTSTSPSTSKGGQAAAYLRYSANFGTAFKNRTATALGGPGAPGYVQQNIPGAIYNNSESGFVLPSLTNSSGYTAGLADFGTRFKAVFSNIPSGVTVLVSTTNIISGAPAPSTAAPYAVLVLSETSPENGSSAPVLAATTTVGGVPVYAITPVNGTATAVWEVLASNTNTNQNFDFLTNIGYSSNTSSNSPATGPMTVNMSYAPNPTQGAFSASSGAAASSSLPIPRFADTSTATTFATINLCTTTLLFPYVTTITGFETGLAISNTSADPFGTSVQDGSCTLYWYGNPSGTPNPANTTTPTIPHGTTWTGTASSAGFAGPNFTGYMFAICNFQYAHGYAAITDIGVRNILSAYLPLIVPNADLTHRTGGTPETLTH